MRLLWLPDVLRKAGLTVHEYPGWKTRGYEDFGADAKVGPRRITGVICHATASARNSTPEGDTRVLWVTGSTSAPVPIAQLYLARSGEWWVGASGRCNHVAFSQVRPTSPLADSGNSQLIGIEAANDNRGEPWPAVQLDSYQRGVAAICRYMGWEAWRVLGHAEHQFGRANNEPCGIDMSAFRAAVARLIEGDDMPEPKDLWKYRGYDYVNVDDRPTTKDHQLARAHQYTWETRKLVRELLAEQEKAAEREQAILAAVAGDSHDAILAKLDQHAAEARAHREQIAARLEGVLDQVAELVAEDSDPAAVVASVRELLGRVRVTVDAGDAEGDG